ncbi:MAG: DDE-type integrase/transposase/recombinase [Candidatus Helarchaeota archaeon]
MKNKKKKELHELVWEMYHNSNRSIQDIAKKYERSKRTIYRWLNKARTRFSPDPSQLKKKQTRPKKYPKEIFNRIIELKEEIPQRSAPMIHKLLKKENSECCPSISLIRKFIRDQGLTYENKEYKKGYKKFQKRFPNDLWQIDIAGVQTVGHLKQIFLIGLLDDCSRFVVSAEYFRTQEGKNVIKIIRDAVINYGRPNQILADNGRQFRSVMEELGTRYTKLLESMGVKPIFSKPYHPQTKGKVERWFGVIKQMFLPEGRNHVSSHPDCSLADFNQELKKWVEWYNFEKPHESLPHKCPPAKVYFETEDRIFKPLEAKINWDKWLHELNRRKVSAYNTISYKGQHFDVHLGYSRLYIDIIEHEEKIELYYKDKLLITHPYEVSIRPKKTEKNTRKIRKTGTISYKGKWYSIDYKLAGKTVEVQETNDGRTLLAYLKGVLLCEINL